MYQPFRTEAKARQIIDKFHVKQIMLKAMDEVIREEQGKTQSRNFSDEQNERIKSTDGNKKIEKREKSKETRLKAQNQKARTKIRAKIKRYSENILLSSTFAVFEASVRRIGISDNSS